MVVKVFVQYPMASVQYCSLRPSGIRQVVETRLSAMDVLWLIDTVVPCCPLKISTRALSCFARASTMLVPKPTVFPQTNAVVGHRQWRIGRAFVLENPAGLGVEPPMPFCETASAAH